MLSRTQGLVILAVSFILIVSGSFMALNLPKMDFTSHGYPPDYAMDELFRLTFFNIPLTAVMFFAFIITIITSVQYLRKRDLKWDYMASSSVKLGIIFGTFALITQALMAKGVMDSYWSWHPMETIVMVQWFIFAAYLSLRVALPEENQRARLSAILMVFGLAGQILTWATGKYYIQYTSPAGPQVIYLNYPFILGLMITGHILLFIYLMWHDMKVSEIERYHEDRISRIS